MALRQYREKDYEEIRGWWACRGLGVVPEAHLPEVGYIVDGVAVGFLTQTDSRIALIEILLANPKTEKKVRDRALDTIVWALEEAAAERGFLSVVGVTRIEAVAQRALKNGFKALGKYELVYKEIE
jgi:hypothetical protein